MNIVYYTAGSRDWASSRLRAWKVADALAEMGHTVTMNPPLLPETDVLIVQKRTDVVDTMQVARKRGVRIIYDVDDYIPNLPVECADVVTVDTAAKRDLYPGAIVIPDCLDIDEGSPVKITHNPHLERVVWYGNVENAYHVRDAYTAARCLGLQLFLITSNPPRDLLVQLAGAQWFGWNAQAIDHEIIEHDLVICPYVFDGDWPEKWVKSKSANRVLKAWALGMPVAGTAIPSYVDVGLKYCASTPADWERIFSDLADQDRRVQDAAVGLRIAYAFSARSLVYQWLEVFNG